MKIGETDANTSRFLGQSRVGANVERVRITSLRTADSPRLEGQNREHTRLLAENFDKLPPILVHRQTMRVIDGNHRLRAALLRNENTIEVVYFDGAERDAFVLAVRTNTTHGLPLSKVDRYAAAARIIRSHPEWSDRAIAAAIGIAPRTVARIRTGLSAENLQPGWRAGLDGRARPTNAIEGRIRASEIISRNPDASLREIGRLAGISPTTAGDVRNLVRRGEDPRAPRDRTGPQPDDPRAGGRAPASIDAVSRKKGAQVNAPDLLESLRNDPQMRFTESGREVLRWLASCVIGPTSLHVSAAKIPPHCGYLVAALARCLADDWLQFADDLEGRARGLA